MRLGGSQSCCVARRMYQGREHCWLRLTLREMMAGIGGPGSAGVHLRSRPCCLILGDVVCAKRPLSSPTSSAKVEDAAQGHGHK